MRRKKVNPNEKDVRIDFKDQNGDCWTEYPIMHSKFKQWIEVKTNAKVFPDEISDEDLKSWFKDSPWYKSTANDISWKKRIELQSVIQKYTSHSLSSTLNLPSNTTKEEVAGIYMYAYDKNLKGVTIYVDGCRTGVLVNNDTKETKGIVKNNAPIRPDIINCNIHHVKANKENWIVIIGLLQEDPYEVFAFKVNDISIPKIIKEGKLAKIKNGVYNLLGSDDELIIKNITKYFETTEEEALTRLISTSLRHGADIKFIQEQLDKSKGDITTFSKAISRTLALYLPKDTTKDCPSCNEKNSIILQEGCKVCQSCGYSAC